MAITLTQCTVVWAGPVMGTQVGVQPPPTPDPVIQIMLSAVNGSFTRQTFYAPQAAKNHMLAAALAAISNQANVDVAVDAPPGAGAPAQNLQCYKLWVSGS